MLRVDASGRARKFLERLPPKHGRQIATKIMELRVNPEPHDSMVMKGQTTTYRRADVGEYRIIYRVEGDVLRLYLIGKRNDADIYRRFRRLP